MTQQIARTSKGPIEYRFEGNGPTIVVLNGGHCSPQQEEPAAAIDIYIKQETLRSPALHDAVQAVRCKCRSV